MRVLIKYINTKNEVVAKKEVEVLVVKAIGEEIFKFLIETTSHYTKGEKLELEIL